MLKRVERILVQLNSAVITIMMFVMFALVFTNVVTRYIFSFSMNWAEELSRYLMIWITYLGAGLAMREGRHAAIDAVQDLLPSRVKKYFRMVVGLIIVAFMGFLAYLGWDYSQFAMMQRSAVLRLPMGVLYLVIPIGAIGFILHLVMTFRDYIDKSRSSDEPVPAIPGQKGANLS